MPEFKPGIRSYTISKDCKPETETLKTKEVKQEAEELSEYYQLVSEYFFQHGITEALLGENEEEE